MSDKPTRKHTGTCFDCGGQIELLEFDAEKGTRIMKCQACDLYHFYKRDLFGGWKLLKVTKKDTTE